MISSDQPSCVTLETSQGSIVIELYWKHAPRTCRNFAELAKREYYNGVPFHRVIRDFMIQGGDPTGTGRGGASIYGRYFEDEISPELKHTGAGIISMANSGPNTNGSQFFITLAPTQWLDGKHTIFGRVKSGMQVVKRLGMIETDPNDRPVEPIVINRAYLTPMFYAASLKLLQITVLNRHWIFASLVDIKQWNRTEPKMDRYLDVLLQLIDRRTDTYITRLEELVAISSISDDINHRLDVLKALRWCGIRLKNMGFEICYRNVGDEDIYEGESLPLHPTERMPLPFVLCASLGHDLTKRTLLIYGHVDVKAVTPQEAWVTNPFKLTVIEGRMYGRGQCNMEVPVNVRFLIEGGEETGSEGLPELLQEMKKDFLKDIDCVAISDSHWLNIDTPCLTYGLRGVIYFYVYVEGSKRNLHSGCHGGAIQEPLIDLQALMSSLISENGKVLIPGVYDYVRRPEKEEL
uniref:peptidylprolyl isomerase n=1 Tax=Echinococcus canadensis TaxID=519352 RepID=A0A915EZU1_9CEST